MSKSLIVSLAALGVGVAVAKSPNPKGVFVYNYTSCVCVDKHGKIDCDNPSVLARKVYNVLYSEKGGKKSVMNTLPATTGAKEWFDYVPSFTGENGINFAFDYTSGFEVSDPAYKLPVNVDVITLRYSDGVSVEPLPLNVSFDPVTGKCTVK